MDFTPSEAATEVAGLATSIATSIATPERVAELEAAAAPIDDKLWRELAAAGLLGLTSSGDDDALGAEETVAVTTALGRHLARVPFGVHAVAAIPALTEFGSAAIVEQLVGPASTGEAVLSAAFESDFGTEVVLADGKLSGVAVSVPFAAAATALLVKAVSADGPVVSVVPTNAAGVTIVATPSTGLSPMYTVEFDGVAVADDAILSGGAETAARVEDLLRLAVAADQSGVVSAAIEATATYAREREQFGRPIGSFQAVAQRLADGYIDAQALALTVGQAAWLLSATAAASAADISAAVATAKFWADDAGHRVAHTAVHVHGGVGLDTSHPAHRFFLRAKQNEFTLGSAPVILDDLADSLLVK